LVWLLVTGKCWLRASLLPGLQSHSTTWINGSSDPSVPTAAAATAAAAAATADIAFPSLQQPYYFGWMNHLRSGLYAMTAYVALMLTINCWIEHNLQGRNWLTEDQKAALRLPRARLISDLAMELLPAALAIGVVASWLRLKIAQKRALDKFRCAACVTLILKCAMCMLDP
jgi:hypothetical protein